MPDDAENAQDDAPHQASSDDTVDKPLRPWNYAAGSYRTRQLVAVAALVALEGLVALGAGLVWTYLTLTGDPTDETASLTGAVFVILAGLLLLRMAFGFWRVDVWPRVPTIVIQLALVPVSWSIAFTLGNTAVGVPLLAVAIVLLVLLFSKPVREAYNRDV
ncbi:MAG: hypothetical protein ACK5MR_02060 [Cumulibacter sp.]